MSKVSTIIRYGRYIPWINAKAFYVQYQAVFITLMIRTNAHWMPFR